jgi:virginiamycin A acetyltransferase
MASMLPGHGPDPRDPHPMKGFPRVCFIKNTISNPNIIVGDYTYYDDPEDSENFERNVLYHYPFIGDRLIIGRFCAIAQGVRFIMNGANHKTSGLSTFPFSILGHGWQRVIPAPGELPYKGDTIVGNDVWLGYESLVMPGVRIGDGAIVAARSMVVRNVPPYSVVGGNPAELLYTRFSREVVKALRQLAWWDWDCAKISRNLEHIVSGDIEALRTAV